MDPEPGKVGEMQEAEGGSRRWEGGRGGSRAGGMRGRSPEEPPQEGVRALDPLLGLRHQLHGLPLLAGAVHRSRFSCSPSSSASSSSAAAAPGARRARARGGARAGCGMRDPAGIGDERLLPAEIGNERLLPAGIGNERLLPAGGTRAAAALESFPERDSFGR